MKIFNLEGFNMNNLYLNGTPSSDYYNNMVNDTYNLYNLYSYRKEHELTDKAKTMEYNLKMEMEQKRMKILNGLSEVQGLLTSFNGFYGQLAQIVPGI